MKKFKFTALLILVCLIFAACSPENKNPANDSNDGKDAVSNENVNGEEVTEPLYWDILGGKDFGGTQEIILNTILNKKDFISEYEKKEPKIGKDIENFITSISQISQD